MTVVATLKPATIKNSTKNRIMYGFSTARNNAFEAYSLKIHDMPKKKIKNSLKIKGNVYRQEF